MPGSSILLDIARQPDRALELTAGEWNQLISLANQYVLLARLGAVFEQQGLLSSLPDKARLQIRDASVFADFNRSRIRFEINRVQRALCALPGPIALLKGGAYVAADLAMSRGRVASDLDILVPKAHLVAVKDALVEAGWRSLAETAYDEHYYQTWMHELAPLAHPERDLPTDVHHTIAPPTSRAHPNVDALWDGTVDVGTGLKVLGPADMVLHAAVHLFNEDLYLGFRDLLDVHDLLVTFGQDETFWPRLEARARRHDLGRVLYYALNCASQVLSTPIPQACLDRVRQDHAPPAPVARAMLALLRQVLLPFDTARPPLRVRIALSFFYVRSHWLRMPPLLLLRHLSIKTWFRLRDTIPLPSAR